MPKVRIIRITSVEDIDVSKVSVYDLNNRYIDARGNMYGLRYNQKDKKIEIIRIIRTPIKAAGYFDKKILERRRKMVQASVEENEGNQEILKEIEEANPLFADEPFENAEQTPQEKSQLQESSFNPDAFIKQTIETMQKHRERLHGIMMNIKNSNAIRESDREGNAYLINVFRTIDIDGIQRIDKVLAEHKEFVSYPRSLVYYLSKLDTRSKNIVDSLNGESEKMRFIFLAEMFFAIRNLYRNLHKILRELEDFLLSKSNSNVRGISHTELKMFEDAKISVHNTIAETEEILQGCMKLEHHIFKERKL
ncbi:MAG: hypothetical protein N2316_10435 [Spirochaetes bacterium]|nr:hypothetical protein [Spirochaetota bacterium]